MDRPKFRKFKEATWERPIESTLMAWMLVFGIRSDLYPSQASFDYVESGFRVIKMRAVATSGIFRMIFLLFSRPADTAQRDEKNFAGIVDDVAPPRRNINYAICIKSGNYSCFAQNPVLYRVYQNT